MTNTTDHWAAHPEWAPDRRLLTLLIPLGSHKETTACATALRDELDEAGLVPCSPDSLHQTIYTFGWSDDLDSASVGALERRLDEAYALTPSFDLTLGPLEAGTEGVWMQVRPEDPLRSLRGAAHKADGATDTVSALFGHASVGYCAKARPRKPLDDLARRHADLTLGPVHVSSLDLVWLTRSPAGYSWERIHGVALLSR